MRPLEAGQHVDQRRLAGAVRPDQAEHLAGREGERHVVNRDQPAEADGNTLGRELQVAVSQVLRVGCCQNCGNFSTVKRPTAANLPSCTPMIDIGRVVWMCRSGV